MPTEEHLEETADRFSGHLLRLVPIAVAAGAEKWDATAARHIERARALRPRSCPEVTGYVKSPEPSCGRR
ncbi:DUF6415 family natural product biosynthesis protein [Streptomyces pratisoli]|uniref:DUF6415 family natural product biosynthesis protein n=1 Tax=Streptomyces pratisoli TaxID=3139917 RepID=UPI003C12B8BF